MQANGLVVRHVSPSLSVSRQEFRIETPRENRIQDPVIVGIRIVSFGDLEEMPSPRVESGSGRTLVFFFPKKSARS